MAWKAIKMIPLGLLYAVFYTVYCLSFLIPRSRKIWIFDSWKGTRFADNAKYFFLYTTEHQKQITAVWLTKSPEVLRDLRKVGYKAYLVNSFGGLYYTLRAKIFIFDSHPFSINFWVSGGLIRINLWHGLPLKKILYDSRATKQYNWVYSSSGLKRLWYKYFFPKHFLLGDYALITSSFWSEIFSSSFRLPKERLIVSGYPRNDALLKDIPNSEIGIDEKALAEMKAHHEKGEKNLVYMPTFRDGMQDPILKSGLSFDLLDAFFREKKTHFFLKFHHEKNSKSATYTNVHFIESNSDAYPLVKHADILMTDYSSIYFDYLFLDRPIVFFAYDLAEYKSNYREVYFDFESFAPGPKAYNATELKEVLAQTIDGEDAYGDDRRILREKIFSKGGAGDASIDLFKKIVKI